MITGTELAAELEAFFISRPDISRHKAGQIIRHHSGILTQLRGIEHPKPGTIAKVRAFIANPPEAALKCVTRSKRKTSEANVARVRRQSARSAEQKVRDGIDPRNVKQMVVRQAMYAVLKQQQETAASLDPVQQAIRKLQRKLPTFSATVTGGPEGMFYYGGKLIDKSTLLRLAA